MLTIDVDKVYRNLTLGNSLKGMDVHYMAPTDDSLKEAMDKYTRWLDEQVEKASTDWLKEYAYKQIN